MSGGDWRLASRAITSVNAPMRSISGLACGTSSRVDRPWQVIFPLWRRVGSVSVLRDSGPDMWHERLGGEGDGQGRKASLGRRRRLPALRSDEDARIPNALRSSNNRSLTGAIFRTAI